MNFKERNWKLEPCENGGVILVRGEYRNQILPEEEAVLMREAPYMLEMLIILASETHEERLYESVSKALGVPKITYGQMIRLGNEVKSARQQRYLVEKEGRKNG